MSDVNDSLAGGDRGVDRFEYLGETASLETARSDAAAWVQGSQGQGQGDEVRHRLLLVVTELATNAINAAPSQMFEIALAPIGLSGVSVRVTNGISGAGRSAHRCSASSGERGPNLETGPGDGAGRPHTIGGVERPGWDCSQTPVGVGRSKEPSYGSP